MAAIRWCYIAVLHCTHYARLLLFISLSLFCLSTVFMAAAKVTFLASFLVLLVAPNGPEIAGTGAVTPDNYSYKSQCYIYVEWCIVYVYGVCIDMQLDKHFLQLFIT